MAKIQYPLEQVLIIKKRRVEEAEKVVREKEKVLEEEKKKLAQREAERDKVKQHQQDKLAQLRHELDHSTTSPKIQQMKAYLKVVEEKLKQEEKKVKEQQVKVETATKELDEAKKVLRQKQLEVDKLELHKEDWVKTLKKEIEEQEERDLDEIGTVIYGMHQKKLEKEE